MAPEATIISAPVFFLADHAEAVNGKLYVVGGGFDRIFAANGPPVIHAHMSIAVTLSVPWSATNQRHSFALAVVDSDGGEVLPALEGEFETGRPPGMRAGDSSLVPMVFNLNNVEFPRFGDYRFELRIDGSPVAEARLKVEHAAVAALQG